MPTLHRNQKLFLKYYKNKSVFLTVCRSLVVNFPELNLRNSKNIGDFCQALKNHPLNELLHIPFEIADNAFINNPQSPRRAGF